jgi:glucose/arabinose dehydrogenase
MSIDLSPISLSLGAASLAAALAVAGCGESAHLAVSDGIGSAPTLPQPTRTLIPTVNVAKAAGWPAGAQPVAAPGTGVVRFAEDLQHPRWVYTLPNDDVLVAETDAPPKPEDGKGIRGFVMKTLMKKAGSGRPSANRITLLRDADRDGVAETKHVFLQGLNSPFGMALVGSDLFVANTDSIVRFRYIPGATSIAEPGVKVTDLPGGPLNHHWTKNIIASGDGTKLYATAGSNSNVAEN